MFINRNTSCFAFLTASYHSVQITLYTSYTLLCNRLFLFYSTRDSLSFCNELSKIFAKDNFV